MAMTSGSKVVMSLVKSGQLFLTRRRKLLAFHVINFNGSFFLLFSSFSASFSLSLGFFADPSESFSTTLKNRFILLPLFFTLCYSRLTITTFHFTLFASTVKVFALCLVLPPKTQSGSFFLALTSSYNIN